MLRRPAATLIALVALSGYAAPVALAAVSATPRALADGPTGHAARTVAVRDEGKLRFVSAQATTLLDEGMVAGSLPGRAAVRFVYNGSPSVSAAFTIHTSGGSISGTARCRLSNPTSPTPSFRGALQITGGGGRYAKARGAGELFGVFHRHGYGLVVQAIGRLTY